MKNIRSFFKTIFWLILIIFLGLIQVWIMILQKYIDNEVQDFTKFIIDGYFIFFIISIAASFVIDEIMLSNNSFSKTELFLFIFYPSLLILVSTILHLTCQLHNYTTPENALKVHVILYFMTLIYIISHRLRIEKLNNKK